MFPCRVVLIGSYRGLTLAIVLGCCLLYVSTACAQADLQVPSTELRAQLFRELGDDVDAFERQGNILKRVVQLATPSVVHIEARKTAAARLNSASGSSEEAGSGVIIFHGDKYYTLTNRHVIRDSTLSQIRIRLADGRVLLPKKVWTDKATDVAVMEIAAAGLVPARVGNSARIEIGDYVLAVGSPFGLSHSVTYGIISAKGRRDLELGNGDVRYQDFMQTDAAINPGNSGGPLLSLRGEVIGINTAIASSSGGSEGIGFTIPINMFMAVAEQLVDKGTVVRAYLGVRLDSTFNAAKATQLGLARPGGARVKDVTPNSPAEAAELQAGDVILRMDDTVIEDDDHLVNIVCLMPVGQEISLVVFRDGKPQTVTVRVGKRSQFESE